MPLAAHVASPCCPGSSVHVSTWGSCAANDESQVSPGWNILPTCLFKASSRVHAPSILGTVVLSSLCHRTQRCLDMPLRTPAFLSVSRVLGTQSALNIRINPSDLSHLCFNMLIQDHEVEVPGYSLIEVFLPW